MIFLQDRKKILNWLEKMKIKNFALQPDDSCGFIVHVNEDVDISKKKLKYFPVQFGIIKGSFLCFDNQLTSLEGGPTEVYGHFNCGNNNLTSLEFCPHLVQEEFGCSDNLLTSLKHSPDKVNGFFCRNNELTSLEFCPNKVNGNFFCLHNKIDTLVFFPSYIKGQIMMDNNPLKGFEYRTDFKGIYEEHLIQKNIHDLKKRLEHELNTSSKLSSKIKI